MTTPKATPTHPAWCGHCPRWHGRCTFPGIEEYRAHYRGRPKPETLRRSLLGRVSTWITLWRFDATAEGERDGVVGRAPMCPGATSLC